MSSLGEETMVVMAFTGINLTVNKGAFVTSSSADSASRVPIPFNKKTIAFPAFQFGLFTIV